MKEGMEGREERLGTRTGQGSGAGEERMSSRDSVQGNTELWRVSHGWLYLHAKLDCNFPSSPSSPSTHCKHQLRSHQGMEWATEVSDEKNEGPSLRYQGCSGTE